MSVEKFVVSGTVLSIGKHNTPQYIRNYGGPGPEMPNEDYGYFEPDVGLLIADGLGGSDGGMIASRTVVDAAVYRARDIGLALMPRDEAGDAVREDIIPFANRHLAKVKEHRRLETASTTLGALLLARNSLVTVGIGDTPAFGYSDNGDPGERFIQLTKEQGYENEVDNVLSGRSRSTDAARDQIYSFSLAPNQRFLIATDGLLGDRVYERLPEVNGQNPLEYNLTEWNTPHKIVDALSRLPARLDETDTLTTIYENGQARQVWYNPKEDDMTIGVMLVGPRT